jgi:hypothetical protein
LLILKNLAAANQPFFSFTTRYYGLVRDYSIHLARLSPSESPYEYLMLLLHLLANPRKMEP